MLKYCLRQIIRTPVKTFLFFLLLLFSSALLSLGAGLWKQSIDNLEKMESLFSTVGTVEQNMNGVEQNAVWNSWYQRYQYYSRAVYDKWIEIETLDIDGADYVHEPEKRPVIGAVTSYSVPHMSLAYDMETELSTRYIVVELEPVEDCMTNVPVRMKVKEVLYGRIGPYTKEILFCDHDSVETRQLYSGVTYIMSVQSYYNPHEGFEGEVEYRPVKGPGSTQYTENGELKEDPFVKDTLWEEVTKDFYQTSQGKRWLEYIDGIKRAMYTIPVLPTNSSNLIMDFYEGNARIYEGRDLTAQEYQDGAELCLIKKGFADYNGINVGDKIPLSMYFVDYAVSPGLFYTSVENLLNSSGELFPYFQENTYEVVGIYDTLVDSDGDAYGIGQLTVVIPEASIKNSFQDNINAFGPLKGYNTSFQIPNGTIPQFTQLWESIGEPGLRIKLYDKGYSEIHGGLERLKSIAYILLIAGGVISLFVIILFCHLFIARQKKRTAIDRALGITKKQCSIMLMISVLIIGVPAGLGGGGLAAAFSGITEQYASQQEQYFDTDFSSWVNASDIILTEESPAKKEHIWVYLGAGFCVILLTSAIASIYIVKNLTYEPIQLLGESNR